MPHIDLQLSCPLHDSFRVQQILGMFDMPTAKTLSEQFSVELPDDGDPWRIGVIVGPSGSGKSSIARKAYGRNVHVQSGWPADRAVVDCFGDLSIRDLTQTLCAVGFSSPPAWIKPFAVLSNGEKFRCELARALLGGGGVGKEWSVEGGVGEELRVEGRERGVRTECSVEGRERGERARGERGVDGGECHVRGISSGSKNGDALSRPTPPSTLPAPCTLRSTIVTKLPTPHSPPSTPLPPVVFDEFTSLVDRTVAKISSAALARAIRGGKIRRRFVAVTCHYDVVRWLEPDWVLDMANGVLSRRRLRRPAIRLRIRRASRDEWPIFRRHHYLSGNLHKAAQCYIAEVNRRPAAFVAVLPFPHPIRPGWREHRCVCLPDFQGVGIGSALSAYIASLYVATKKPYFSTSSHPAVIHHRARSPLWKMRRKPGLVSRCGKSSGAQVGMSATLSSARCTAGFEYVGEGADNAECSTR